MSLHIYYYIFCRDTKKICVAGCVVDKKPCPIGTECLNLLGHNAPYINIGYVG